MHTKKINKTNKLIQVSYHYILTKITKLKKEKKNFVPVDIARNWSVQPVFKPVRNVDVSIPVYVLVRYIPASTTSTGTVSTTLI